MPAESKAVAVIGMPGVRRTHFCEVLSKISAKKYGGNPVSLHLDSPLEINGPTHKYTLQGGPPNPSVVKKGSTINREFELVVMVIYAVTGRQPVDEEQVRAAGVTGPERFVVIVDVRNMLGDDAEQLDAAVQAIWLGLDSETMAGPQIEVILGSSNFFADKRDTESQDCLVKLLEVFERKIA